MYPKLNPEPIEIYVGERTYKLPRGKLVAAFAGATAHFESELSNMMGSALFGKNMTTFQKEYEKAVPDCIQAANIYLSATVDMLEAINPANCARLLLKDKLEHDNPLYPFFEED